jgi:hypothetical protein
VAAIIRRNVRGFMQNPPDGCGVGPYLIKGAGECQTPIREKKRAMALSGHGSLAFIER